MVSSEMATTIMKPPKGPSAPRAKSTSSQQTTKPIYTRTLKVNTTSTANSVYKSRSDTSLTSSIRNLSIRSGSAASSRSSSVSSGSASTRRFNSAGRGTKCIEEIARQIANKHFKNIVVMAGAGISTASGIPDFRTPGTGLYDNLRQYRIPYPQAVFDIEYFARNPKPFYALAKELYPSGKYRPNYVHYFLRLLYEKGILLRVYTQNIDGLERLAGIPPAKLIEAHGSFVSASCILCKQAYPENEVKGAIFGNKIPRCKKTGCFGTVKPDIVFFGEDLPRRFYYYLRDFPQADLLLVMGTSLEVEPFAGIVDSVRMYVPRILFNREAVGPFEKKRRMNDIVVEGDIVEKIRGFVMQLGWKQELEMLIQECENNYKRSLIESSSPANKDTSSSLSMSRDSFAVNSNSSIVKASNASNTGPAPVSPQTSRPVGGKTNPPVSEKVTQPVVRRVVESNAQEINKVKEVERSGTTPSSIQVPKPVAQVPKPATPPTTTAPNGERVIAGPNSCFNPALLRQSRLGPPPVPSMAETLRPPPRRGEGSDTAPTARPAGPGGPAGHGDWSPGGRPEPGTGPAARRTETEDAGDGGKGVRPANSRQAADHGPAQHVGGGVVIRHSFEGVKKLLSSQETPCPEPQDPPTLDGPALEKAAPSPEVDDLKGFFTMPDTSHHHRRSPASEKNHPKAGHRLGSAARRSPASNTSPLPLGAEAPAAAPAPADFDSNRVKEWLSSGKSGHSHQPSPSGAHSDEDQKADVKPVPRSRSNSAHSTIRRQTSTTNDHTPSGTFTREVVRLKMRYNLTNNQGPSQTSLFQRTHKVPSNYGSRGAGEAAAVVRHAKSSTPTRYCKYTRGGGGTSKPPPAPEGRKPLFTGLRQVNFKPQAITATVTKTTLSSGSARTAHPVGDPSTRDLADQPKALSAGALPRISYRHRMSTDIAPNVRSSRMSPLLAQLSAEGGQCLADEGGE